MSLVVGCDTGSLGLDDIFRLISGIDVDGNIYIRLCDDETPLVDLSELSCEDTTTMLDILRGALFLNDDGEYCLNVSSALAVSDFCATYQTIYDSFATPPSDAIAAEQNTMVCGLVDDGVWAKLDVFYMFAQSNGTDALINWFNPGTFDATNVHATAFTALEGFTGDGANDYINCNWNPATNGINYAQNSASMGTYIRTNVSENRYDFGVAGAGTNIFLIVNSGGNSWYKCNDDTWSIPVTADSRGLFIINRTDAANHQMFRNKVVSSAAAASVGTVSGDAYVLCLNSGGPALHTTKQASLFFAGGGLTQTNVDNLTDRFETYMDSNGKGVIP